MFWRSLLILLATVLMVSSAQAGMPSLTFTEAAGARLNVISFFLAAFFVSAFILRWAWNTLVPIFPKLPRLGFKHACALMLVTSLLMYVMLTLISGARELMTPGAWVRVGSTYQLATPERDGQPWLQAARQTALEHLREQLWAYAKTHQERLPPYRDVKEIPPAFWAGIHPHKEPFAYIPNQTINQGRQIIVYETESYGPQRYVLLTDGSITLMKADEVNRQVLAEVGPPPSE